MRHLTVSGFGDFLGVHGNRLIVRNGDNVILETALSRLRTIRIDKSVSLSSNLILACAARGIRIYFLDWKGVGVVEVSGMHRHAVVGVRKSQFECLKSLQAQLLAKEIIFSKIRNQRAVLLYFSKYLMKRETAYGLLLRNAGTRLEEISNLLATRASGPDWKNTVMGLEGSASLIYWNALKEARLLPETFQEREGRGSTEITNAALNYGYAILHSYIQNALGNAGLEIYAGLLHADRAGKPSLVLDCIEEYRAWVVDRNVISLRCKLGSEQNFLDTALKKQLVELIDKTMSTKINYSQKQCKLENALQRQVYKLAGAIVEGKRYRGIRFKW